ncbi:MAG: HNH endonuclease signature motif containing protein [Dehalococcoidia bacterium]|jgi:hypothetical protein
MSEDAVASKICECGCGKLIQTTGRHLRDGVPRFAIGHYDRKTSKKKEGKNPFPFASKVEVVACKKCDCGCEEVIELKKWHFDAKSVIPRFIRGHNPATAFENGNKLGWKGGEITDACGYVWSYSPNHPYKNAQGRGYVKRHRLAMEKHLGRYLVPHEVVHHINGIKGDDRIENLLLTTNSEHMRLHHVQGDFPRDRNQDGTFARKAV